MTYSSNTALMIHFNMHTPLPTSYYSYIHVHLYLYPDFYKNTLKLVHGKYWCQGFDFFNKGKKEDKRVCCLHLVFGNVP